MLLLKTKLLDSKRVSVLSAAAPEALGADPAALAGGTHNSRVLSKTKYNDIGSLFRSLDKPHASQQLSSASLSSHTNAESCFQKKRKGKPL